MQGLNDDACTYKTISQNQKLCCSSGKQVQTYVSQQVQSTKKSPSSSFLWTDGRLESQRGREGELGWLWFGRAWNGMGGNKKFFPTFVYDVVVHQKIRSRAQLDRDGSIDTRLKLWPGAGQKGLLFPINTVMTIISGKSWVEQLWHQPKPKAR